MKLLINILTFLLLSKLSFTQQIKYVPVFVNQCSGEYVDLPWLIDFDYNSEHWYFDSAKSVILPQIGEYNLYLDLFGEPERIEIINTGITIDTFYTKRLDLRTYISNPPYSEFFDCDSIANGQITDYYYNGNIRITSTFKNGQPIDTLKKYSSSGKLLEIYLPFEVNTRKITFYKNGQIKSDYNYTKRYDKEYYESGQLAKHHFWNKKYRTRKFEYYKNGNLKSKSGNKIKRKYSENGVLLEEIKRKEILIFDRLFAKERYERHSRFYEYKWRNYNSKGQIIRETIFNESGFLMSPFPDSVEQIEDYLFSKVTFYKNGIEHKKIEEKYFSENEKLVRKFIIYRKEDNEWIEEGITTANNIYSLWRTMCIL